MSAKVLEEQIVQFLESDEPEVLAIRGHWGVGKTYAWNKFLRESKFKRHKTLQKYSYVSLFGINSLDALKFAIYQHSIDCDQIGNEPGLFGKHRRGAPLLKDFASFMRAGDATVSALASWFVSRWIICIDDFERKGKALCAQDVLGLISNLKEQKRCKIVLILNDEALQDNAVVDYQKYREKVIDKEIRFDPTSAECAAIALSDDDISKKLKEFSEKLGINNIRIIKKVERLAKPLVSLLKNFEPEITHSALHTLTLMTWSFYSKEGSAPSFDFIKGHNHIADVFSDRETETENAEWKAILRKYDYGSTDELDLQIAKIVEKGYIEKASLIEEATKLNEAVIASKATNSFSEAWEVFHGSFDANEKEVAESLYTSAKANIKYVSLGNLDGAISLLRELGYTQYADELIELSIKERPSDDKFFDIQGYPFWGDLRDKQLIEKFSTIHEAHKPKVTLIDAIKSMTEKNGWSAQEEEALAAAKADDFYRIFKETKGKLLSRYVDVCLSFTRFANPSERQSKITEQVVEALRLISNESPLNKRRMKKFRVKL
jgi:hypothetical protein